MRLTRQPTLGLETYCCRRHPGDGLYDGHRTVGVLRVEVDLVEGDHVALLENVEAGHVGQAVCGGENVEGVYRHSCT